MKIIYVHCDWRNEYRIDPRRYEHYWTSIWNKAWKKNQVRTGFEPMTFAISVQRSFVFSSVHNYTRIAYIPFHMTIREQTA